MRSNDLTTTRTILPPKLVLSQSVVYASQGNIYALDVGKGTVRQQYSLQGQTCLTVLEDILYLNVSCHPDYTVQALSGSDGTSLWSYKVEGRLNGSPVIVDGVVYVSVVEGTIYALQASDGKVLWHSAINPGSSDSSFLYPITFASPTVVNEVVYLASAVNPPLKPFMYAFQAKTGELLWKAQIAGSTSSSLTIIDGVIYINTHHGCFALHTIDGSCIWQHKTKAHVYSQPIVLNGIVYTCLTELRNDRSFSTVGDIEHQLQVFLCARQTSDGSLFWRKQLGITSGVGNTTFPVIIQNAIYIGADNGVLYAFQTDDCLPLWSFKTEGNLLSPPTGAGGVVYVGANDGFVYALRAEDGVLLWKTFVSVTLSVASSLSINIHFKSTDRKRER